MAYIVLYSFKFNIKTTCYVRFSSYIKPRRAKPPRLGLIWGRISLNFNYSTTYRVQIKAKMYQLGASRQSF